MIQFRELLRRLRDAELEFVVVGGVAATLHGVQEPTRDLDVCIRLDADSWKRIASLLRDLHPRFALTPDRRPFTPDAAELQSFKNLYVLTDLGRVDFLGEVPPLGDIDRIALDAQTFEIDGASYRVISINDLLQVKEHVRRPKDLEVAAELRAIVAAQRKR